MFMNSTLHLYLLVIHIGSQAANTAWNHLTMHLSGESHIGEPGMLKDMLHIRSGPGTCNTIHPTSSLCVC